MNRILKSEQGKKCNFLLETVLDRECNIFLRCKQTGKIFLQLVHRKLEFIKSHRIQQKNIHSAKIDRKRLVTSVRSLISLIFDWNAFASVRIAFADLIPHQLGRFGHELLEIDRRHVQLTEYFWQIVRGGGERFDRLRFHFLAGIARFFGSIGRSARFSFRRRRRDDLTTLHFR